jgi:hypothetical protein
VDAAERKNFDEDYARASWGAAVLRPYMNVLRIEWRSADRKNAGRDAGATGTTEIVWWWGG